MSGLILKLTKFGTKFLQIQYQINGICPISFDDNYRPQESRRLKRYSIFLVIYLTAFIFSLYYEKEHFINNEKSNVGETVDFIQLVSMRMSSIIIVLEALIQRQHLINYFNNLHDVDSHLMDINVKMNFKMEQFKDLIKIIIAASFCIGSELMVVLMYHLRYKLDTFLYWISYIPFYIHCCMRYFQLMQFIMIIKRRIDIVNVQLSQIDIYRPSNYDTLDNLRRICYKLFIMSHSINRAFGLSTLVNITNDFITVTLNSYFIFVACQRFTYRSRIKAVESIFWSLPHCINIIVLATCCQVTVLSTRKIGMLLHRIKFNFSNGSQSMFMSHFSIQLLLQKVEFNAFGFFKIDFSLLYAIAATVTTYLVILIQFYLNEKSKGTETNFNK
ncbi:putative gustatory receptor 2a [Chironomus tepperi]|uniref:putative gustatory receptor 2a n=1 Tax=Chironomus tepperi TaxID=113505 RepID=UPI00391F52BD